MLLKKSTIVEDLIKLEEIKEGFTNNSYYVKTNGGEYFYQFFQDDKYNHKINAYKLNQFDFVPKVLYYSKQHMITKYLKTKGQITNPITDPEFLKTAANILHTLHNSKLKFPKCNIIKRMDNYHDQIKHKMDNVPIEIYNYKKIIYEFVKSQEIDVPCHNDPACRNFFQSDNKFYLCDWEYATMNNRHFDLAFFIAGCYLTKKQEEIFLSKYGEYDANKLHINKIIVYYLTLLWLYRFDELLFDDKPLLLELRKLMDKYL